VCRDFQAIKTRWRQRSVAGLISGISPWTFISFDLRAMASSSPDLDQVLAFAISLARECGDRIKTGSEARFKTQAGSLNEKKNSVDREQSPCSLALSIVPRLSMLMIRLDSSGYGDGPRSGEDRMGMMRCARPSRLLTFLPRSPSRRGSCQSVHPGKVSVTPVHRRGGDERRRTTCPDRRADVRRLAFPSSLISVFQLTSGSLPRWIVDPVDGTTNVSTPPTPLARPSSRADETCFFPYSVCSWSGHLSHVLRRPSLELTDCSLASRLPSLLHFHRLHRRRKACRRCRLQSVRQTSRPSLSSYRTQLPPRSPFIDSIASSTSSSPLLRAEARSSTNLKGFLSFLLHPPFPPSLPLSSASVSLHSYLCSRSRRFRLTVERCTEWGSDRSEAVMERKLKSFSNLVGEKGAMVRGLSDPSFLSLPILLAVKSLYAHDSRLCLSLSLHRHAKPRFCRLEFLCGRFGPARCVLGDWLLGVGCLRWGDHRSGSWRPSLRLKGVQLRRRAHRRRPHRSQISRRSRRSWRVGGAEEARSFLLLLRRRVGSGLGGPRYDAPFVLRVPRSFQTLTL
jgi:hypothetical protein